MGGALDDSEVDSFLSSSSSLVLFSPPAALDVPLVFDAPADAATRALAVEVAPTRVGNASGVVLWGDVMAAVEDVRFEDAL